jgi:hypothetical protein
MSTYPQEVVEMRAKIRSLDNEVSRLKGLEPKLERLQNLLKAWDQEILEGRWQWEALEAQAFEAETQLCEALVVEVELNTANAMKEKVVAYQKITTELLKGAESRCENFKRSIDNIKSRQSDT